MNIRMENHDIGKKGTIKNINKTKVESLNKLIR